jgi:hypothetical protein
MTKLSKVLAVFIAALCLAFMAFAGAAFIGGPNWLAESQADDLKPFRFDKESDAQAGTISWSVSSVLGSDEEKKAPIKKTPVLADAIIAARKKMSADQDQQISTIKEQIEKQKPLLKLIRDLHGFDTQALAEYRDNLRTDVTQQWELAEDQSKQVVSASQETQAKQIESGNRREDIVRLATQLDVLRTDLYQAEKHQEILKDLLYRLQAKVAAAQRTRNKLIRSGAQLKYEQDESE